MRETGLVAGCGHRDHCAEAFSRTVKRMIEDGDLGKMVTFEATTARSGGFLIGPDAWRGSREHNPGGMLFQCGVHKLHELIYDFGPVRRIRAAMCYDLHETDACGNLRSFYRAVVEGGTPYPSGLDGARALAPVFAAAEAAESGAGVDVEDF